MSTLKVTNITSRTAGAPVIFASPITTSGSITTSAAGVIGTTLAVTGATTLSSTLLVSGTATLNSNLVVATNATVNGITFGPGAGGQATTTAVGYQALKVNTGASSTAVGSSALAANTSGQHNTCIGSMSGATITTGKGNVGIGSNTLNGLITGGGNVQIGGYTHAAVWSPAFDIAQQTSQINSISIGNTSTFQAYVQVPWTTGSDQRDKMNFQSVPHGLSFVNQLNPLQYQFKESRETEVATGRVRYGFKAQEILAIEGQEPVIIDNTDENRLRYNSDSMIPILVKAIQELKQIVDQQAAQISTLGAA